MIDYRIVDLDLPSGTLWADRNIGARIEYGRGLYFACGDPKGYNPEAIIDQKRIKTVNGFTDQASLFMGEYWCLPTLDQFEELIQETKFRVEEVCFQPGIKFFGKNGNSIFIPFAGNRNSTTFFTDDCLGFYLWSSTYEEDNDTFKFIRGTINCDITLHGIKYRTALENFFSVRGVLKGD